MTNEDEGTWSKFGQTRPKNLRQLVFIVHEAAA
jgi:hypothetical protein